MWPWMVGGAVIAFASYAGWIAAASDNAHPVLAALLALAFWLGLLLVLVAVVVVATGQNRGERSRPPRGSG